VDKSPLGVHEIKFVVNARKHLGHSCVVADHAYSTLNLGKITPRYYSRWLIVDPTLEASWTPADYK
jgi:hypothetical protein